MFILIPLILILGSVVGISIIIFRKMPYLNRLTPEIHVSTQTGVWSDILTDLFPEFSEGFKGLKFREYGNLWLVELEKFIRRLRVFSLKMDRISDSWIKRIRRSSNGFMKTVSDVVENVESSGVLVPMIQPVPAIILEDMKKEEQRLIIEIAKKPKDSVLYEKLGDLYVKMKDLSDAKESYEAAIELGPSDEKLQKKLSKVTEKLSAQSN